MPKDVIVALDFAGAPEALEFLEILEPAKPYVKIGLELYCAAGPEIVRRLKARGHRIFLDLKLHDIPHTVEKAMKVLSGLGADMADLHAAGTREMMRAALTGLTRPDGSRPLLIAVTQLTSTSEERMRRELLIGASLQETVAAYAQNAAAAGLDGAVCSPLEAELVKKVCGRRFLTVTPGIRFAGGQAADQVRITTPARAREIGADYIVIGRPITQAPDPAAAYRRACREFLGAPALPEQAQEAENAFQTAEKGN